MKIVTGVLLTVIVGAVGLIAFMMSGVMNVGAAHEESAVIGWFLENVRENSIEKRAEKIAVPDLSGEMRLLKGASDYAEMCAGCHGAPGKEPFEGAQHMNPKPPSLADIGDKRTPGELFWVIKNGIRMTGMPAWGQTHSDDALWDLVAFVQRLPNLSRDQYRATLARAESEHVEHSHMHDGAGQEDDHDHRADEVVAPQAGHVE